MDSMSVDIMPGGDDFREITSLFREAAGDMEPGSVILMDGFSLQDAMSAFEIGEPRLDSGVVLDEERRPPFNPLTPLLPQELCWIMDRSFACEMEWHTGNTLSQTVFTILYAHHLEDINPDIIVRGSVPSEDISHPFELVSVVLRSFIFGLLKCCDLAWREMSGDRVHDGEDWQGEKCDISLLEGVTVKYIHQKLEEASFWLQNSSSASSWRDALLDRIHLRKTILQLMELHPYKDPPMFQALISTAQELLRNIRARPSLTPAPGSPAALAFDPYIARRLNSFLPLRVFPLPLQEEVWGAVESLLNGWRELCFLSITATLTTWEISGCLRAWLPRTHERIPYLRSLTQSAFYDGVLVLNKFTPNWIVDRFFIETLGISKERFVRNLKARWVGPASLSISDIEHRIIKVTKAHIRAQWFNSPRRRRHFMKSLIDWHALYDAFIELTGNLSPNTSEGSDIMLYIPDAILLWRLSVVREVIFSGFQLELYTAADESAFAYWYAAQVLEAHLSCLDNLMRVVPEETAAHSEMGFQHTFLTALQIMSIAMFSISMKYMTFSWERMQLNFFRRYKWAFIPEYDEINSPMVAPPQFNAFISGCAEMVKNDDYSPSESFKLAKHILLQLSDVPTGWAGQWANDRIQFICNLADISEKLSVVPTNMKDLPAFDISILKWDTAQSPWFPTI